MKLIETRHLKTWAAGKSAESQFPHLVKNLIRASIQPEKLKMPSGDAVWVPGYDGEVVSQEQHKFVPEGFSFWEAGTDASPSTKASRDYNKRTFPPDKSDKKSKSKKGIPKRKIDRSKTTFVFTTPLVWANKDDWVEERKKDNVWLDVAVIDGADIQEWLEESDSVQLQFAAELGLIPVVSTADSYGGFS